MEGVGSAIPKQLFVAAVDAPDDPSQNIKNGYQYTIDTTFDSFTQLAVFATLGSRDYTMSVCRLPSQGTFVIDRLLAILEYLAIKDPGGAIIGLAASDPANRGKVDKTRIDSVTTALGVIAIQQVLGDLQDTDDGAAQRMRAQEFLDEIRVSTFMVDSNCIIDTSAFWPTSYNTSFGNLMAMAGSAKQCGGETPSLLGTSLWLMAVSGSNPFRLIAGFHPPPTPANDNGEPWFDRHKVLFYSLCGCIGFIVVAAVISLVIANAKKSRKIKLAEEERKALVNPQLAAAQQAVNRQSDREKKNMGFF